MSEHAESRCQHCGQVDDHPKSHWNTGETFHHDCLPYDLREQFLASSEHAEAILAATEEGKRGHELRAHIRSLHEAPSVGSDQE